MTKGKYHKRIVIAFLLDTFAWQRMCPNTFRPGFNKFDKKEFLHPLHAPNTLA